MMQILVARAAQGAISSTLVDGMHALRYDVFRERLGWDIPAVGRRERDAFDDCNPVFVLARDAGSVVGCCRLLPTTGPYMLKDTFPQLLGGRPAPADDDVWEISRFAVAKDGRRGFGFSTVPATMIRELVRYAVDHGIRRYVFVTTTAFERLLQHLRVHLERFSAPLQIGVEMSVALTMHIDTATIRATGAEAAEAPALQPWAGMVAA
jgi:acyl homoserine lactone synthase